MDPTGSGDAPSGMPGYNCCAVQSSSTIKGKKLAQVTKKSLISMYLVSEYYMKTLFLRLINAHIIVLHGKLNLGSQA